MTNLKRQFNKTTKVIEKKGRHSKEANAEFKKLGEIFKFLKFSPRMFDDIAAIARHGLNSLREKEKLIQTQLVKNARIPRKDFLVMYPENLTKVRWVDSLMKEKKYKKDLLEKVKQDVVIAQKDIIELENKVGISVREIKEINRNMSMGETKMRRAKKDMVEANLRLVISIAFGISITSYYKLPIFNESPIINVKFANSSQDSFGNVGLSSTEVSNINQSQDSLVNKTTNRSLYQAQKIKKLELMQLRLYFKVNHLNFFL